MSLTLFAPLHLMNLIGLVPKVADMFMMHEMPTTQEDTHADGDNNKDMECNIRHNNRLPLQ